MSARKLESLVSGKVARTNPFEGGPAFEAWKNHSNVMASTWGDYVSRLAELVNPDGRTPLSLDELLAKLCISRDELHDDSIHFDGSRDYEFDYYESDFMRVAYKEAADYYAPEIKRMQATFDAIVEGYRVPDQDAANEEAVSIQNDIDYASSAHKANLNRTVDDYIAYDMEQTLRVMRRDALYSGVVVQLSDFVKTMLRVNLVKAGDFKSELAHVWVRALSEVIDDVKYEYRLDEDTPADRIYIGLDTIAGMRTALSHIGPEQELHYQRRWQEVKPVFITHSFENHSLVTGDHEK